MSSTSPIYDPPTRAPSAAYSQGVFAKFVPDRDRHRARRRGPRRRVVRRVVVTTVALAALLAVGAGGYLAFLDQTVSRNLTREPLLPAPSPTPADAPSTRAGDAAPAGVGAAGAPTRARGLNYLLIGSDARPGDTFSRSDVIMLAHVTAARDTVYLVHFPRDLYVDVPGHGKDKINAAYAYGGAPLLVSTLQDLVDVRVDHVAKIDFSGFERMTDAVGGVRVWATQPSTDRDGTRITTGWNDLDGSQALAFVRERKQLSEGDISRGHRQQAFLRALLTKALSPGVVANPLRFRAFVDAAASNTTVDDGLSMAEIRAEALRLRGLRGDDVVSVTAPFDGFGTSPSGASIDVVDAAGMGELGDAIRHDALARYVARR